MNRSKRRTIIAGTGIASLALLVAMAQTDALDNVQVQKLGLGIGETMAIRVSR